MVTAASWEKAGENFPREIQNFFNKSGLENLADLRLLLALPKWAVSLPGGGSQSQTDVMALASNEKGLVAIAVDSKVDETFTEDITDNPKRLDYLQSILKLDAPVKPYQLMHRTASAIITAQDFHIRTVIMLVHSFSEKKNHFDRFQSFCEAMSAKRVTPDIDLFVVARFDSPRLFLGWCQGNADMLKIDLSSNG